MLPLEWKRRRRRLSGLGKAAVSGKGLQQRGATGCNNRKGTWSSHENWGFAALLTLAAAETQGNAAVARMSRELEAPVLQLHSRCLLGPAYPTDAQQQLLLRALRGEGSSRGGEIAEQGAVGRVGAVARASLRSTSVTSTVPVHGAAAAGSVPPVLLPPLLAPPGAPGQTG